MNSKQLHTNQKYSAPQLIKVGGVAENTLGGTRFLIDFLGLGIFG